MRLLEQNMGQFAPNPHNSTQQIQLSNPKYFSNGNGPPKNAKKSSSVKSTLNHLPGKTEHTQYRSTNYGNFEGNSTQTISNIY
jgi:hypothetical protein